MSVSAREITVAIPTYRRGGILLRTLGLLMRCEPPPVEIIVVDQTEEPPAAVAQELRQLGATGRIRWLRLSAPSIPHAMNVGLLEARGSVVLFLDDDIEPAPDLVASHAAQHGGAYAAVCGQVLQPGEAPESSVNREPRPAGLRADLDFRFNGTDAAEIANVMAGNLSVSRAAALAIGGFDEQFAGAAYRFETDFARRLVAAGQRILFAPAASIWHLRMATGGTRSRGDHLAQPSPRHSVGDYYFALRHGRRAERAAYLASRLFRETVNRHMLGHPWLVPRKVLSELRAWAWARRLVRQGPRLIPSDSNHEER